MGKKNNQIVFEMGAKLSSEFSKSMGGAQKHFADIAKHANELNKQQKELGKFRELRSGLSKTRQEFTAAQNKLVELSREMKKNPSGKLSKEYKKAQENVEKLSKSIDKKTEKYKDLNEVLKKQKINTGNLAKEQAQLRAEYDKTAKLHGRMNKLNNTGNRVKGDLTSGGLAMKTAMQTAVVAAPIKIAANDESNLGDIRKVFKMSAEEVQIFRDQITGATKDIPMMNKEIYDIAAAAGMAGIEKNEVIQFTKDAAMMSKAFNIQAGEAGNHMATWREAFKMNQNEVVELMDQINYLGNEVNALPSDMTKVIREIGTLGNTAGFATDQTAALAASLIASGNSVDMTKTAMKQLYTTLSAGAGASNTQKDAYVKLGFDSEQIAKDMQKDAQGTMLGIMEAINNLESHEKVSTLKDLFGQESVGVLADLITNTKLTSKLMDDMGDKSKYAGSSMEEYKIKTEDLNNQMLIMKKAFLDTAVVIGREFIPVVKEMLPPIIEGVREFSAWAKENPELTKTLMKSAVAMVAVNAGIGALRLGIGNLLIGGSKTIGWMSKIPWGSMATGGKAALSTVKALSGGLVKMIAIGAKFLLANPIVALGAAIAGGAYLIYKNWDQVKEYFDSFVNWSGEKFSYLYDSTVNVFGDIKDGVIDKWEGLKDYFKNFATWFIEMGQTMITNNPVYKMGQGAMNLGKDAIEAGKEGWQNTKQFFSNIPGYATGGVVTSPQLALVGEGGSNESIIPHDSSQRSRNLWDATGRALGISPENKPSINLTFHYTPTFVGTESKTNIEKDIKKMFENAMNEFQRQIKRTSLN